MPALPGGRLAELSRAAVVRVAALTGQVGPARLDAAGIAALLYRAGGCLPGPRRDPRWAGHVVTAAEREAHEGLAGHARSTSSHWHGWTATDADPTVLVHKIYVSPDVRDLHTALVTVLSQAPRLGVPAWKVGAHLAGLHRPDKIVLYLSDAGRADRVAAALALMLGDLRAQGVPFTGQVGASGIVSRGRDVTGTSWRADVCRAVADAVLAGRAQLGAAADATDVAHHALTGLAHRGLDVRTWHPTPPAQTPQPLPSTAPAEAPARPGASVPRPERADASS